MAPLLRIAQATRSTKAIIVSLVVPNARKPNWRKAVDFVWEAFERCPLEVIDRVRIESNAAGIGWDVALFGVRPRPATAGFAGES